MFVTWYTIKITIHKLVNALSKKNDTDVAHYNFNAHQLILVFFGSDVAERLSYQMVIYYPTSPSNVSPLAGET